MDSIPELIPIFHGIGIGSEWRVVESGMSPTGIGIGADSSPIPKNIYTGFKFDKAVINYENFDCVCSLIKYRRDKPAGRLLMIHMFLLELDKRILVGINKIKTNVHDK